MYGNHLLLKKAFTYRRSHQLHALNDCEYQDIRGLWVWNETNEPLVKSRNANRPMPGTKKEDIETGEDLKSE